MLAFLGSVYVVFLICHFLIPGRLADHLFSDEHEQRMLLVGPVEKARAVNKWILETAAFGFGLRGSLSEGEARRGRSCAARDAGFGCVDASAHHQT